VVCFVFQDFMVDLSFSGICLMSINITGITFLLQIEGLLHI